MAAQLPLADAVAHATQPTIEVASRVRETRSPAPILAARVLQLHATVLSHERFQAAAAAFATEIAQLLGFDRAVVGFVAHGRARIVATSHTLDFKFDNALLSAFSEAMEEALDQASTVALPKPASSRPVITRAHSELAKHYPAAVCTVPLVNRGQIFGVLTLTRASGSACTSDELAIVEHVACLAGPLLELKSESERSWNVRLAGDLRIVLTRLRSPRNGLFVGAIIMAIVALVGLSLMSVQYRVGAQARLEGSIQRALAAPVDGFLRQVYARPGDAVKAGQVLAELADEDLKLEQRKLESELAQHENAASAALARADRAQFVIHQARADEAQSQIGLVNTQLARSRIVAPFDGILIKGDLSPSLGGPVRRGEVLMTLAPADDFRLIVEVDERDVPAIRAGQRGSVALGAISDRALTFRVDRIVPVATARDGHNFFEVQAELDKTASPLRPGLQGVAKIDAGERSLFWISTHRLTEWLSTMLWTLGLK